MSSFEGTNIDTPGSQEDLLEGILKTAIENAEWVLKDKKATLDFIQIASERLQSQFDKALERGRHFDDAEVNRIGDIIEKLNIRKKSLAE